MRACSGRPIWPKGIWGGPLMTRLLVFRLVAAVTFLSLIRDVPPRPKIFPESSSQGEGDLKAPPQKPTLPKRPGLIGFHMFRHVKGNAPKCGQYNSIVHTAMVKIWRVSLVTSFRPRFRSTCSVIPLGMAERVVLQPWHAVRKERGEWKRPLEFLQTS